MPTTSDSKRAVILAGGKGRRLQPYTITFPKPLVPVGEMPILEIVIRQLKAAGFTKITMAVGHLAELIMAYFGDGSKWGLEIEYSREEKPLGTVGPLALIDDLPETFLVMNGDVLTTLSYDKLFDYHIESGAELTIACHRCNSKIDLGVIEFDGRLEVTGYREKPVLPYDASMGIYVFNRSLLDTFTAGDYIDFPTVVDTLIKQEKLVKVFLSENEWLDIGRPDDYAKASERFAELRDKFLPIQPSPPLDTVAKHPAKSTPIPSPLPQTTHL
jgi:NDP-sugar pyrophosphorylase family protein